MTPPHHTYRASQEVTPSVKYIQDYESYYGPSKGNAYRPCIAKQDVNCPKDMLENCWIEGIGYDFNFT